MEQAIKELIIFISHQSESIRKECENADYSDQKYILINNKLGPASNSYIGS